MATYKIKTNQSFNVNGTPIHKGLSVEVMTFFSNPFDEMDKIHNAYLRIHGIDFKAEGILTPGYFQYEKI